MSQYTISIDEMLKIVIQTIEQYSNYDNDAILPKKTIADVKKQIEMLNEKSINIIDNKTKEKEKQLMLDFKKNKELYNADSNLPIRQIITERLAALEKEQ